MEISVSAIWILHINCTNKPTTLNRNQICNSLGGIQKLWVSFLQVTCLLKINRFCSLSSLEGCFFPYLYSKIFFFRSYSQIFKWFSLILVLTSPSKMDCSTKLLQDITVTHCKISNSDLQIPRYFFFTIANWHKATQVCNLKPLPFQTKWLYVNWLVAVVPDHC